MSLRKSQSKVYFRDSTPQTRFLETFSLPDGESSLIDLNAILGLKGKVEVYSGRLHLTQHFLTFISLDRRALKVALPLHTVKRVEKLGTGAGFSDPSSPVSVGVYALGFDLCHGERIVVQLNALKHSCDQFSSILRKNLKACLPRMKLLKNELGSFYSEALMSSEHKDEDLAEEDRPDVDTGTWTTRSGLGSRFHGGLGQIFKYPGDPKMLREKAKYKLWKEYFTGHGRNLSLFRYPAFSRLVQVGLPNKLRGEIWEICAGSVHLRTTLTGEYEKILEDHKHDRSISTDEIEKDLNRSLPEYPAYQQKEGIDTLRRVLTAYSWKNPDLGYCQAMNIVVAAFLIYTSEEQCFWLLHVLCDRLVPGYYNPSMYGTLLDQKVFEHLVERCLPMIHNHLASVDIQLSVASLPWFLSLYISSMPMVFAFRIVDCFFLMGPKILFQIGLAILKINGPELLKVTDDGMFINVFRNYFNSLGDSAHPNAAEPRMRNVTRFQELLVVAFREFNIVTDDTIANERKRFRNEIVDSIENFAKRAAVRNLKYPGRLERKQLELSYDNFQLSIFKARDAGLTDARPTPGTSREGGEKAEPRLDRATFGIFMSEICSWARDVKLVRNGFMSERAVQKVAEHDLIDRIFYSWDIGHRGALSFQDVITGLNGVLFNDLMANIEWFFNIHDQDSDGYLTKDEVLQLSESLLFIFRHEKGDHYLAAISKFLQNAFEMADIQQEASEQKSTEEQSSGDVAERPSLEEGVANRDRSASAVSESPKKPYLNMPTFRMVVLADELLEAFFDSHLTSSFQLENIAITPTPKPGLFGGFLEQVISDDQKEKFTKLTDKLADEVGKRLDMHSEESKPAIGKLDQSIALNELKARESLLTPSNNNNNNNTNNNGKSEKQSSSSSWFPSPLSAAAMRYPAYPSPSPASAASSALSNKATEEDKLSRKEPIELLERDPLSERDHFKIDDVASDEEGALSDAEDDAQVDDGQIMSEVNAFLMANGGDEEGLTGEDREVTKNLLQEKSGQGQGI